MEFEKDPLGKAIEAYKAGKRGEEIVVLSDICDEDIMPVDWMFRSEDEMPIIEKTALNRCKGKVLDVGSGCGVHAKILQDRGFDVTTLETSPGGVDYQRSIGLNALKVDFYQFKQTGYDTVLMMMNGIGITGKLSRLEETLFKAKMCINADGKILLDSTDVKYLYEDEDGSLWMDLNTEYHGDFVFEMKYGGVSSGEYGWLYVDFPKLTEIAAKVGLKTALILSEGESYLAELTIA